nr:unnamed protein product [Callosobruchus chinensis]
MENHPPDSPDSIPGDLLRDKRRRTLIPSRRSSIENEIDEEVHRGKNNNNDVDFVLMDDESHENGADDEERLTSGATGHSSLSLSSGSPGSYASASHHRSAAAQLHHAAAAAAIQHQLPKPISSRHTSRPPFTRHLAPPQAVLEDPSSTWSTCLIRTGHFLDCIITISWA